MSAKEYKPIVKWAGGKRRVLASLLEHCPKNFERYHEPFLGSGVMFFKLCSRYKGDVEYFLSDANPELINMYIAVREDPGAVYEALESLKEEYIQGGRSNECFNSIRRDFNGHIKESVGGPSFKRAAYFLFLNRTCFNGLWRVNAAGAFNVPHGRYKRVAWPSEQQLRDAAEALGYAEIERRDFKKALTRKVVGKKAFVYADPPYCVDRGHSSFVSYTSKGFDDDAHGDLCKILDARVHDCGASVMVSNSASVKAQGIYGSAFSFHPIAVRRSIAADQDARITLSEALFLSKKGADKS